MPFMYPRKMINRNHILLLPFIVDLYDFIIEKGQAAPKQNSIMISNACTDISLMNKCTSWR